MGAGLPGVAELRLQLGHFLFQLCGCGLVGLLGGGGLQVQRLQGAFQGLALPRAPLELLPQAGRRGFQLLAAALPLLRPCPLLLQPLLRRRQLLFG